MNEINNENIERVEGVVEDKKKGFGAFIKHHAKKIALGAAGVALLGLGVLGGIFLSKPGEEVVDVDSTEI